MSDPDREHLGYLVQPGSMLFGETGQLDLGMVYNRPPGRLRRLLSPRARRAHRAAEESHERLLRDLEAALTRPMPWWEHDYWRCPSCGRQVRWARVVDDPQNRCALCVAQGSDVRRFRFFAEEFSSIEQRSCMFWPPHLFFPAGTDIGDAIVRATGV